MTGSALTLMIRRIINILLSRYSIHSPQAFPYLVVIEQNFIRFVFVVLVFFVIFVRHPASSGDTAISTGSKALSLATSAMCSIAATSAGMARELGEGGTGV